MKKIGALVVLTGFLVWMGRWLVTPLRERDEMPLANATSEASRNGPGSAPRRTTQLGKLDQNSDHVRSSKAQSVLYSDSSAGPSSESLPEVISSANVFDGVPPRSARAVAGSGGPSIGTITVLGHRGCDVNTQGWFLSSGRPDQYDFTVSPDGNSVFVTPNVALPTGNFEFAHCRSPGEIVGHRVRMTVMIRAEGVSAMAHLRFWGENYRREKILYAETQVGGTHEWKEYSLESDVMPEITLFSDGLSFRSPGKLWISHPTFEVLEESPR